MYNTRILKCEGNTHSPKCITNRQCRLQCVRVVRDSRTQSGASSRYKDWCNDRKEPDCSKFMYCMFVRHEPGISVFVIMRLCT